MPKSTKAEVEHRIDEVYDLLINRVTYRAILGYGAQRWGVKERQMNVYIARAHERIKLAARGSEEEHVAGLVASYNALYARQMADKDYRGAKQTLDGLARLLGVSGQGKKALEAALPAKGYIGIDPEDI